MNSDQSASGSDTCALPFGGAQIAFPQTFDLRIIFTREGSETLRADLSAIFVSNNVPCTQMQDLATNSGKYGRLAASVLFADLASMRSVYEAVGRLPCVRGLF